MDLETYYGPLRAWVAEKEDELFTRPIADFGSVVAKRSNTDGPFVGWLKSMPTLEAAAYMAAAKGTLSALAGTALWRDNLTFAALALHLSAYVSASVFDRVDQRLARKMKGKLPAVDFSHGLNLCVALKLSEEATWMASSAARFVSSGLLNMAKQEYATYSIMYARKWLGLPELPWPEGLDRQEWYETPLNEWPDVSTLAIKKLVEHHELGKEQPEPFEPGWEWALMPFDVLPVEILALRQMLPSVKGRIDQVRHPMLGPWMSLELAADTGSTTRKIKEIAREFQSFVSSQE
ncbi:MAG: hypothetical protein IT463_03095 [Planctomycetes bacterium]|nr:hypothetical protein [Planctomycetota bacterium]